MEPLQSDLHSNHAHRRRHVVALPYPSRGHMNPMLALCRRLAARGGGSGLLITVVVTEEWLALISSTTPTAENLRFETIPNLFPSERDRGKDYMAFSQAVKARMLGAVEELLLCPGGLEPPVDAIMAEAMLPWVPAMGKKLQVPVVALFPQAAAVFSALLEFKQLEGEEPPPLSSRPEMDDSGGAKLGKEEDALRYLPRGSSNHFPVFSPSNHSKSTLAQSMLRSYTGLISWCTTATATAAVVLSTFPDLEPIALDNLRRNFPDLPTIYSLPCIPVNHDHSTVDDEEVLHKGVGSFCVPPSLHMKFKYEMQSIFSQKIQIHLEFLDSQPDSSVLYVSLGSFLSVSSDEMEELAWGLSTSGCRLLWVARDDDAGGANKIKEIISKAAAAGVLVVPWCDDQLGVLCHRAVGGFLTHCGWNSTLESIYAGVPMLTYPLMWDQFPNSKLIAEDWRVGIALKGEEEEESGVVVGREEIAMAVRKLMGMEAAEEKDDHEEEYCRETIMRRTMQIKEKFRGTWIEGSGGSSWGEMDHLLREILKVEP